MSIKISDWNTKQGSVQLIPKFSNGISRLGVVFAVELEDCYNKKGRKLNLTEAHSLFNDFSARAERMMFASIQDARSKMASRDLVFRDALHEKLGDYIKEVSEDDFEKFLGEQSMTIEQRLEEIKMFLKD